MSVISTPKFIGKAGANLSATHLYVSFGAIICYQQYFTYRYERHFILTGIVLDEVQTNPAPAPTPKGPDGTPLAAEGVIGAEGATEGTERPDRQKQLLAAARGYVNKLSPDLPSQKIVYVRVLKSPAPFILECECETKDRWLF
jgi:hypothetical protein